MPDYFCPVRHTDTAVPLVGMAGDTKSEILLEIQALAQGQRRVEASLRDLVPSEQAHQEELSKVGIALGQAENSLSLLREQQVVLIRVVCEMAQTLQKDGPSSH